MPGDNEPHILSGEGSVSEFQKALIAGEISSEHYKILWSIKRYLSHCFVMQGENYHCISICHSYLRTLDNPFYIALSVYVSFTGCNLLDIISYKSRTA